MKKTTKKKASTKKVSAPPPSPVKNRAKVKLPATTVELELTAHEVCFIRDLMGVLFPTLNTTLAVDLAAKTGRIELEEVIWAKICDACLETGVPVGETAPDYVIAPIAAPMLGVFELPKENENNNPSADVGLLFENV